MQKNLPFLLLLLVSTMQSQTFTPSNLNVFLTLNVSHSNVGDYDNDGDLDIIVMGLEGNTHYTQIYDNDGAGNFSLNPMTFSDNYRNGEVEFIDYDNDNDIDIFISGRIQSGIGSKTALYENNAGIFTEVQFVFGGENIGNNQFGIGDLDNDGDSDLIFMGNVDTFYEVGYLYRNDGNNNFTELSSPFLPLSQGEILLGDLDNDGDNDVVIAGLRSDSMGTGAFLEIYENNGNFNFIQQLSLEGYINGDMELRDCNNDGLIDIIKNGTTDTGDSSKMYLNNGGFSFTENTVISLPPVGDYSNFVSADYNGNGELDFLISGRTQPYTAATFSTSIMVNSGNLVLSENNTTGITNYSFDDMKIGDFDNDHDIDVFVMNSNTCNTFTNNITLQNTEPNAPANLISMVSNSDVVLGWDDASDNESPVKQLTYNLYVGSGAGLTDVFSPMADLNTGYRKIVGIGNADYKTSYLLKNLPDGTYYWSVQAIDSQYEGSVFVTEQSFTINNNLSVTDYDNNQSIKAFPNPVINEVNITSNKKEITSIIITDSSGRSIRESYPYTTNYKMDLTFINSGVYFLKIVSGSTSRIFKMVKK